MKKITVTRPYLPPKEEYISMIDRIWENEWLTNKGPLHNEFAKGLEKYLDASNINLVVNGHMALDIAIKSLELKGEVITTPFTFASTTHAIVSNGLKPIFCDINENDLTIDVKKLENLISDDTSAILPVHVYGHPCNIEEINRIANKYKLKVIYDAAHAFGVKYKNQSLCNFGDISIFSFHATKLFHTIEGGALIYKDDSYTRKFNALKNFGIENEEIISYVGGNGKMNEFQAAMGLLNLKYIDTNIIERKKITLAYRTFLKNIRGINYFVPEKNKDITYNYSYFPILIESNSYGKSRDEVYEILKKHNVYSRRYFWPIVTEFDCYKNEFCDIDVEVASRISKQILCLPIYNGLSIEEVEEICLILNHIQKSKGV